MIKRSKKQLALLVITILMVLTSLFSSVNSTSHSVKANELDPASRIICMFDDGEVLVNFYSTDYFHYMFRSKSAVTSMQGVDSSWLNKILGFSGFDFEKVNEDILGRELNPKDIPETTVEESNAAAPKVSAFDRFGVAGLKWSSYQGEWKYHHVNACASQDRISPTTYGTFYEGRLEPKSTHNEVSTSPDPRSIQFNKGVGSSLLTAFTDTISNTLFAITKATVTLTILFVGLAFTDLTEMLGMINSDGTSGGTAEGVFTDLFNGIFTGLIFITIMITAIYILYKGIIKRELRFALSTLIKTIIIFIIAVVMATNPSYWIGMPNKAATYGQALVLSSMSGMYEDESGAALCSTDVASIDEGVDISLSDPDSFKNEFEKTSENMRSMIGCQMWEALLFKPWVRGQFGAEYEELANTQLDNDNESWVGTASVPVGDGTTIDNWALFHLSTQTNAHAPVGSDSTPIIVNGVNADWWRVADAMSDYEEEVIFESDENSVQHEFSIPIEKDPTEHWQSWVGNNRGERLGVAFISILFGIVGSIAPLVFGMASAIYGLGLTILMMTAPIFLLFGTWGGKGDKIFLGWLSALINTMLKKIGAGILLVLSLSFSLIIINMISDIGFITAFMLMIIVTSLLIKNKDKILDILAGVDFGGAFDPREKANQFMQTQKRAATAVGKTGTAAMVGAAAAKRTGQNVFRGATTGASRQLRNQLYTSSAGMNVIRQMDISAGGERQERHTCIVCHMPLGVRSEHIAYRDDDGNYYCVTCADEIGLETLYEVTVGQNKSDSGPSVSELLDVNPDGSNAIASPIMKPGDIRGTEATSRLSYMEHKDMRRTMDIQLRDGEYTWEDDNVKKTIIDNLDNLKKDIVVYTNVEMKLGRRARPPSAPEPLHEYIDVALINMAWKDKNFELIEATYKDAWKLWYEDNGKLIEGMTEEEIEEFREVIENYDRDIGPEESQQLYEDFRTKSNLESNKMREESNIYVYVNGKLVLNNTDIQDTDELLSNEPERPDQ